MYPKSRTAFWRKKVKAVNTSSGYPGARECRAEDTHTYPAAGNYMNQRLVRSLRECQAGCENTAINIIREPDCSARVKQASLLADCADICSFTAKCAARGSAFARQTASLCEDICEDCGAECAKFGDCTSKDCAGICECCAKECEKFTGVV